MQQLLGRSYHIRGTVTEGYQRGRSIGFPTANIRVANELYPHRGVYAGWLGWESELRACVINIGSNPTFNQSHLLSDQQRWSVEAHILGVASSLNIYDQSVRLWFDSYLRDEIQFEGVKALKIQLHNDCIQAQTLLSQSAAPQWPMV